MWNYNVFLGSYSFVTLLLNIILLKLSFVMYSYIPCSLLCSISLDKFTLGSHFIISLEWGFCLFFVIVVLAAPHSRQSFPDQELNPCLLQWKCGVLSTEPQGSPSPVFYKVPPSPLCLELSRTDACFIIRE